MTLSDIDGVQHFSDHSPLHNLKNQYTIIHISNVNIKTYTPICSLDMFFVFNDVWNNGLLRSQPYKIIVPIIPNIHAV